MSRVVASAGHHLPVFTSYNGNPMDEYWPKQRNIGCPSRFFQVVTLRLSSAQQLTPRSAAMWRQALVATGKASSRRHEDIRKIACASK